MHYNVMGYCCKNPNPYSVVYWKGSAPSCSGRCSDCGTGDDCILRNDCGTGGVCWSGKKQLCGRKSSVTYIGRVGRDGENMYGLILL